MTLFHFSVKTKHLWNCLRFGFEWTQIIESFLNESNDYKSTYWWGVCKNVAFTVLVKASFKVSNDKKKHDDGTSIDNHNHISDV